jgi:hypothetical protein
MSPDTYVTWYLWCVAAYGTYGALLLMVLMVRCCACAVYCWWVLHNQPPMNSAARQPCRIPVLCFSLMHGVVVAPLQLVLLLLVLLLLLPVAAGVHQL